MSNHTDEPQDWPLRDWSARVRPPAGSRRLGGDEPVEAEILYEEGEIEQVDPAADEEDGALAEGAGETAPGEEDGAGPVDEAEPPGEDAEPVEEAAPVEEPAPADEAARVEVAEAEPEAAAAEHAEGGLEIPSGYSVLEGAPNGNRRAVAVVVSRFNGEITSRLLGSALAELEAKGVAQDAILVMPVPGAFELPIAAMALAKTRRYACVVALGCVIRGETPHFDYVANEAASGLQLAGIETGVPVSFGVLTCDSAEQAEARVDRGAWAARSALEMADAFTRLRATAAAR